MQVLTAGVVLLAVLLLLRSPGDPSRPPVGIRNYANFVRQNVPPERLQQWASNVVQTAEGTNNATFFDVPVPPEFNWRIPPPCAPWRARLSKPDGTNGPTVVELISIGGFGSYGLVIGPREYVDSYELSAARQ